MKKILIASALGLAAVASQAGVVGAAGGDTSAPFLDLAGLPAGVTLTGGALFLTDQGNADLPTNVANSWSTVGAFLAVGPSHTPSATLSFATGLSSVSFLWGSPDVRNELIIGTNLGSHYFYAEPLGILPVPEGDQSAARYVHFSANGGEFITSLTFGNTVRQDAFEVSNFSVTAVPEPETYALMLAGLLAVGFVARRRAE
jgi:PEP-CTERM motif